MSLRARLLLPLLRHIVKPRLRAQSDVAAARVQFEHATRLCRPVPHTVTYDRPGGLHWVVSGRPVCRQVLLYFHGGGYIVGSPQTHERMLARLSRLARIEVCAPRYSLAPDNPFPAAFEDARAAWRELRRLGYAPRDILIGGDSAGGGLALALLSECCLCGQAPGAAFALSPWTDLTLSGASLSGNRAADPLLPAERAGDIVDFVLHGQDPRDPRVSPLFAGFPGCPPVLFQCSADEILRDDTVRMAERLKAEGACVSVEMEQGLPHVWHLMDGWLPEARDSLRSIARFLQDPFRTVSR